MADALTKAELLDLIDQARREQWTELNLRGRGLTELPAEIGTLTHLQTLHLGIDWSDNTRNQLTTLPSQLWELKQLTTLDLSYNQLTSVPAALGELKQLRMLWLNENQLTSVPAALGELKQLRTLWLNENQLTSVPAALGELEQLTWLELAENQLTTLPPQFWQLKQLRTLELDGNQLTSVPAELGELKQLRTLDLARNQLTSVPEELGELRQLTSLYLSGNQLTSVPKELGELTHLQQLSLQHQGELPDILSGMRDLRVLDVYRSGITYLPVSLLTHSSLRDAFVFTDDDEITRLFRELATGLVCDPTIRFPPAEVVEVGIEAVRRYLGAATFERVWQSKCVVVGEGGVGKTWLLHALRGGQPDASLGGTIGIDIAPLELPHPTDAAVTMSLNCWDFAGQEFNHAMHQFFFSDRALILVVWNARQGWEAGKIERWLDNIRVRAPGASVLLVATHIDEPSAAYPKDDLLNDWSDILVGAYEVDSKTGKNIAQLRDAISQHAAELPLMGVKWPDSWLRAAGAVRALGRHYAGRRPVYQTMQQPQFGLDEAESEILLRWLHELGDVLNFADEPAIADYVLLDPSWLTKRLGEVLENKAIKTRRGILSHRLLATIWPDMDEQIRTLLLHILDKFDLAYRIPEDPEDRSLVVEALPHNRPDYQPLWQAFAERGSESSVRFKLSSMQPGIPIWFIARSHQFTTGRGGQEAMHWRNGALLRDDAENERHRALIICDPADRVVTMTVRGAFPHHFLSRLSDSFLDTLTRYDGLEVEQWIPCPGYNKRREAACSSEFELVDLLELLDDETEPDKRIRCHGCRAWLDVAALVWGVRSAESAPMISAEAIQQMLNDQTRQITGHIDQRAIDLAQFTQRHFLRSFLMQQQRDLVTCPNLFTLNRVPLSAGLQNKQTWRIQLYSQLPGDWRPVPTAVYEISERREWLKKALPYLRMLHKSLKLIAPLAGAALDVAGDASQVLRDQHTVFENEIKLMGNLLAPSDLLPSGDGAMERRLRDGEREMLLHTGREDIVGLRHAEGSNILIIRELMDALAAIDKEKGRAKWGGLTRYTTPEGDILWLDKGHYDYVTRDDRKPPKPPEEVLFPLPLF